MRPRLTAVAVALAVIVIGATLVAYDAVRMGGPTGTLQRGKPVPVGNRPGAVVAAADLWVANYGEATVSRIDRSTGLRIGNAIRVGRGPIAIAADDATAWVANRGSGTVSCVDAQTGTVARPQVRVGTSPLTLTTARGWVWVVTAGDRRLWRIDADCSRAQGIPIRVGRWPSAVTAAGGWLWVADYSDGVVRRVDATTGRVTRIIRAGRRPWAMAAGEGIVWVANFADRSVSGIDVSTAAPAGPPIAVAGHPVAVSPDGAGTWVSATTRADRVGAGVLQYVSRDARRAGPTTRVPSALGIASDGGGVWATDWQHDVVRRLEAE